MASLRSLNPLHRWPRSDNVDISRKRVPTRCVNSRIISSQSSALFNFALRAALFPSTKTSHDEAQRAPVPTTHCLFGGFFGGKKAAEEELPPRSNFLYHDSVPPFPQSLLAQTFLAGKELRCCYKASVDGFSALKFHERCDFKGPCVIVGRTEKGLRFGAFNPEGYRSTDDYYDTFDAFLFYWPSGVDREPSSPIVLEKVGGSGAALFDYARGGPQFGADGLLVGAPLAPVMGGFAGPDTNSGVGDLTEARSRLGLSYAIRPDGKDSLFGDDKRASLVEIEVFCSPAIAALY
ncbi:hypothetical protein R1flu_019464 [Riccia fluitans]|uniref:TLDc domain-containing protein n=1 Tax=Riccia fluitans TaxID=41844 RepID=A0ABD1ZKW6_9MARC